MAIAPFFIEFTAMKNRLSRLHPLLLLLSFSCIACTSALKENSPVEQPTKETIVRDSLALLNTIAKSGDLVVRLGDDFLSQQIRYMSHRDHSYSHVGVVVERDGKKFVCHIAPDPNNADTIRYEPVDSFLNPQKNIACGLYRYDLTTGETVAFLSTLDSFSQKKVHFDKVYNLATNDKIYCSEMIAKALKKATQNRIAPKETNPPPDMLPLLLKYFAKEKPTYKQIAERKFIAIDDLYLRPDCELITSFSLTLTSQ